MKTLRDFPTSGVCWYTGPDLINYLKSINLKRSNVGSPSARGIAWNSFGYWTVIGHSGQVEYNIEQLKPFFPKPENIIDVPLTPDECYPFPEKWYLHIDTCNGLLLKTFLEKHKSEYIGYEEDWNPLDAHSYFFCYPQRSANTYASAEKPKNYTEITTDYFLTHVLTHTDKQQQINESKTEENGKQESTSRAIKVQRPHLTVRDTGTIRATGIRCPKVQVKIGSGYLPD
jgi:hypothetical protein